MKKYFIITVDTEGDNLWKYNKGDEVETMNSHYLIRFQNLCNKYGFKPVYLTNYEMVNSEHYVNEAKEWLSKRQCEIGVHLHAWNNPPMFDLKGQYDGNSYLIEYPEDVMRTKFKLLYNLIVEKFQIRPFSHRAGRWAMNDKYFKILKEFGIGADCSYTPGVDWTKAIGETRGGLDYSSQNHNVQIINDVVEVPATIRKFRNCMHGSWKHKIKSMLLSENVWMRPAISSARSMKKIIDIVEAEENTDFIEFMLHSSEVMPGGSPYFTTETDIDKEYRTMEEVFAYAKSKGYVGATLQDYVQVYQAR